MNKTGLIRTVITTGQATRHLHGSHGGLCQGATFPRLQEPLLCLFMLLFGTHVDLDL